MENKHRALSELSENEQQGIIELYSNGEYTVRQIAATYNVSPSSVSHFMKKNGVPPRRPKACKKAQSKKCPKCYKKIEIKGARFCPYCAADLRDKNEILAERVENKLIGLNTFIPGSDRDEYMETLIEVCKALREKE